jgi:hypothetical protein
MDGSLTKAEVPADGTVFIGKLMKKPFLHTYHYFLK